jgi:hypothetical protein
MAQAEQSAAKQFFVAKILAEATARQVPLSAAEQYMLSWSESDAHFTQDPALTAALEAETSDTDFERKAVLLIRGAYARDVNLLPTARTRWRDAYAALSKGDHYLLVMLRDALGWRLKRWFLV